MLQTRAESDQGYKNFYCFVNHHCKQQVILLKNVGAFKILVFGKSHLQHFSAAEPLSSPALPFPWDPALALFWGNDLVQAEFENLQPNLQLCPFSWDSVTGHGRQPALTQSKGKHFYLNHLQLFKATLLWFALEEPRQVYDSLYEESSSSQLWLWSAPVCIFTWFHIFREGCESFLS